MKKEVATDVPTTGY